MENFIGPQNNKADAYFQSQEDCRALKINMSPLFDDVMSFETQYNPDQYVCEAQMHFQQDFEDAYGETILE